MNLKTMNATEQLERLKSDVSSSITAACVEVAEYCQETNEPAADCDIEQLRKLIAQYDEICEMMKEEAKCD